MANSTKSVLEQLMHEWSSGLTWEKSIKSDEMTERTTSSQAHPFEAKPNRTPCFYRGFPGADREHSRRWLGDRLFCYLNGRPLRRKISTVSSRLRQHLDSETWWFDLLRTLVLRCNPAEETIVVVDSTAPCLAASRAARLFGRSLLRFELNAESHFHHESQLQSWFSYCLDQIRSTENSLNDEIPDRVIVSPNLHADLTNSDDTDPTLFSLPLGDRLLFAAADRIHVLSCRANGSVSQLLQMHLLDRTRDRVPVLLASDENGQLPESSRDLPAGWIPWIVGSSSLSESTMAPDHSSQEKTSKSSNADPPIAGAFRIPPINDGPLQKPDDWLLHWTRAATGPWPGETSDDFLDAQILRTETADHSVVTTLLRILSERVLRASSEGIRGSYAVVAFTAVPLQEFRRRRVYRKHRHRFDFEPWGIAIRKKCLVDFGVRPVIYGDDELWNSLDGEARRYFQKATSGGATNNSEESEWRSDKDVNLSMFPATDVCVFVDSADAARMISHHTLWDVVVVPG